MAAFLFSDAQRRYQDLIGQPNGTIDDFGKRNINRAIRDIINKYKFSWNLATDDLTLVAGVADLPTDYNPQWSLEDARIVNSDSSDDNVFTKVPVWNRDQLDTDYIYWVTYTPATDTYVFNTPTQTGTVTIHYNFLPTDLSAVGDSCIIPDLEALSYLAASKSWVGAERDTALKEVYETEADKLIQAMYIRDLQSADAVGIGTLAQNQGI